MALIYNFNFGPTCDGLEAVVTDVLTGEEVSGSPVTLDSDGSAPLPLAEGTYMALVPGSTRDGIRWADIRTVGVLDLLASIAAGGGGGVSGPAAWFAMSKASQAISAGAISSAFVDFADLNDGRATPRHDLVMVDGEDASTLNVISGGEYLIVVLPYINTLNAQPGFAQLAASVAINGDNESPAYYLEAGGLLPIPELAGRTAPVKPLVFHQTLIAGDAIQVKFRVGLVDETDTGNWVCPASSTIALTKIG